MTEKNQQEESICTHTESGDVKDNLNIPQPPAWKNPNNTVSTTLKKRPVIYGVTSLVLIFLGFVLGFTIVGAILGQSVLEEINNSVGGTIITAVFLLLAQSVIAIILGGIVLALFLLVAFIFSIVQIVKSKRAFSVVVFVINCIVFVLPVLAILVSVIGNL